jgi:pyrimidine-specific ribonucleoside hydrolase
VTTVAGNSTLENTTRNALSVLTLIGRTDIPVAAGAARPLRRELVTGAHVHGQGGLEGAHLPVPAAQPVDEDAVSFIAQQVERSPLPVTLVPTGPLTNIALFRRRQPDLFGRVARICLMGGSIGEGNLTASAEFNIWSDPDAAAEVFAGGRPLTMIGLDVTHRAIFTLADADRMEAVGNATGIVFADLMRFFARFHTERYGWEGSPVHDALAVAHLAEPGLVRTVPYRVDIETESELTRGRTVVDLHGLSKQPANAEVGVAVDRGRFVEMLLAAVAVHP